MHGLVSSRQRSNLHAPSVPFELGAWRFCYSQTNLPELTGLVVLHLLNCQLHRADALQTLGTIDTSRKSASMSVQQSARKLDYSLNCYKNMSCLMLATLLVASLQTTASLRCRSAELCYWSTPSTPRLTVLAAAGTCQMTPKFAEHACYTLTSLRCGSGIRRTQQKMPTLKIAAGWQSKASTVAPVPICIASGLFILATGSTDASLCLGLMPPP